jgi:hypothetical protein
MLLDPLFHCFANPTLHQLYPIAFDVRDFLALFFLLFGNPAFMSA